MNDHASEKVFSEAELEKCLDVLGSLSKDATLWAQLSEERRIAFSKVCGQLSRPDRDEIRFRRKQMRKVEKQKIVSKERQARSQTGIRQARTSDVFTAPVKSQLTDNGPKAERPQLNSPRNCYVCKAEYVKLHHFYDSMCSECGDFNYEKRFASCDLSGQTALITGARLKIGYQAALLMLRSGANVVVTTRFPVDAATRYSKEADFEKWQDRLHIHGLDLRHTPSVELFCDFFIGQYKRLDLLINNAAQTVRRPPGFYSHLLPVESMHQNELPENVQQLLGDFTVCKNFLSSAASSDQSISTTLPAEWQDRSPGVGIRKSATLSQIPYTHDDLQLSEPIFPEGKLDADLQQVDLRETNSWRLKLGQIATAEMLELQLINSVAPFVLCNRLVGLMRLDFTGQKHVVNVSAMEGKFYRFKKADRHPHTNMAKAALNMLTHTSAGDLAKDGIFMNAVDTGWVTDEDPVALSELKQKQHDFQPPLDIVDGAARVCDPFIHGIQTGDHVWGKFLKDYKPIDW
ncbi:MAG: SDR family oxidoreductase [Leptospirales bacterium]